MGQRVDGACHRPGGVVVGRRLHGRDDDRLGGNRPVRVPSRHQPARSPPRWRRETVDPTPHSSRSAVPAAAHRDPVPPARPPPSPARRCGRSRTRDERPIARSCAGDPAAARRGGRRGHGHVERVAGWATRSPATGRWAADRSTGAIRGRPRTVVAAPAFGLFRGGDVRQFGRGGRRGGGGVSRATPCQYPAIALVCRSTASCAGGAGHSCIRYLSNAGSSSIRIYGPSHASCMPVADQRTR